MLWPGANPCRPNRNPSIWVARPAGGVQMGWPLRRRLYLSSEDEDSDPSPLGVEELLSPVLERALLATKATGAAIALSEGKEMVCMATQGTAPDLGMRLDPQFGFSGMCVRRGRILFCDDAETDPRVDRAACQRLGARSIIAVPLLDRGTGSAYWRCFLAPH